ncbi:hypothetical protein [Saccharibacillus sacchari]|uniref:Uncharacterized protein n=1 Tax=Saccharibacillus sacchari TaxID=456493 RepID=A0ACC6PER7_9BACL
MNLWYDMAMNAVYLLGSLLFLAGYMEFGSALFLAGNGVALVRALSSAPQRSQLEKGHEILPLLLYLVGSCFFYVRDIYPGTVLFIAGSLYVLVYLLVPAIRKRDAAALRSLIPLALSLIGCLFFLTSVRVVGTLLFIVSNGMLLNRSLDRLIGSRLPKRAVQAAKLSSAETEVPAPSESFK